MFRAADAEELINLKIGSKPNELSKVLNKVVVETCIIYSLDDL
jgi:hypothetical protein